MNNIKVVLADDHSLFRKGMAKLIGEIPGMEVIFGAPDGEELMRFLKVTEEKPSIILMDLNMPKLNGVDATPLIRKHYPGIKIIVLSVHDEEHFIVRMIENGADGYLFKNAEIEEVEKALKDVMSNGFYLNEKMIAAIRKATSFKNKKASFSNTVHLTDRELEVLRLICGELTAAEIAVKLFLSNRTIEGHRQNLLDKTGARNTAGLVIYAIKNKLLDIGF